MRTIIILGITFLFSTHLLADWPVGKRRTTLIPTVSYFYSAKYYDSTRKIISFSNGDHFAATSINFSLAHGLTRRLDFILNIPYTFISSSSNKVVQSKSGIADCFVGLAYHFPAKDLKSFLTTKAVFIFPGYQNSSEPYLGYASKGFQFSANYSFNPIKHTFCVIEGIYTRYIDQVTGPDQYSFNLTTGTMFGKYNYVTGSFSGIVSSSSEKGFNTNLLINKDFSYGKVSLAYGRKISRVASPYIQGFYTLYGHNSGVGLGISAFVIFKLP